MKRFFLIVVMLISMAYIIQAKPFLNCDPYPTTIQQPTSFIIVFDGGAPIETGVDTLPDGSVRLHYDLVGLANGAHTVIVKAKNVWGESAFTVPLNFTKPAATVGLPTGLKLSEM